MDAGGGWYAGEVGRREADLHDAGTAALNRGHTDLNVREIEGGCDAAFHGTGTVDEAVCGHLKPETVFHAGFRFAENAPRRDFDS